jgi:hypothetical protein
MAEANGGSGNGGGRDRGEGRDASDFDRGDPEHGTGAQRDVGQGPGVGIDVGGLGGSTGTGAGWGSAPPGTVIDPRDPFGAGMRGQAASLAKSLQDAQDASTAKALNFGFNMLTGMTPAAPLGLANMASSRLGGPTFGSLAAAGFRGQPGSTISDLSGRGPSQGPPGGGASPELVAQRSLYEHPMVTQFYRSKFAPQTEANDSLARWVFRGHPSVPRV